MVGCTPVVHAILPAMTTQSIDSVQLDSERFAEIVDLVRRHAKDPEARRQLESDPLIAPAWEAYQKALDDVVQLMNSRLRSASPNVVKRLPIGRRLHGMRGFGRPYAASNKALFTPELAIVLGEIARVARMEPETLAQYQLARTPLDESIRAALGDERRLEALYPLVAVACDVILWHPRPEVEPGTGGMPLDLIMRALRDLDMLQERIAPDPKKSPVMALNIGWGPIASLGRALAKKEFLDRERVPAAYQIAYDEHWHTNSKTKSASGAFVEELREWTRLHGKPELLVVLAASSDGRNRAVAGGSTRTPIKVYDKMIYDNALMVLNEVVQNPRFNDEKAYAMLETNGAPQLVSVMLHGNVDLSIRALACEKAIRHPDVDPYHIYSFLFAHAAQADKVPHGYWRDFVLELRKRLLALRVHGTEDQVKLFEARVKRFTKAFVEEVLKPYAESYRKILAVTKSGREPTYRSEKEALAQAREFVRCHEFVKDPEILDLVLETETKPEEIVSILEYCVEADIPVTKKLMVAVLQHEDQSVREAGMKMLPNIRPEDVEAAAADLDARIRADYEAVRDYVLSEVIPEFEDIKGVLRRRSANHHYFEAANELTEEELVEIFQRCYEQNPTTIPEAFYQATMLRRFEKRYNRIADAAAEEAFWDPTPIPPMAQADLFDDLEGQNGQVASVGRNGASHRRPVRR